MFRGTTSTTYLQSLPGFSLILHLCQQEQHRIILFVGFMRIFKAQNSFPFAANITCCWYYGKQCRTTSVAKLFPPFFLIFVPCHVHVHTHTFSAADKHTHSAVLAGSTPKGYNTDRCGQIELNVSVHKLVVALCAENRWKKGSGTLGRNSSPPLEQMLAI